MNIDLLKFENDKYSVDVSHFKLEQANGIVIVFPGAGYSHMGPCIYYPSTALYENGYELLNIEYDFRKDRLDGDSQSVYADYCDFLIENIQSLSLKGEVIAFTKSVGTRIVGSVNTSVFDKIIWSTPALKDDFVMDSISKLGSKSLVVIGSNDPFYSVEAIKKLKENSVNTMVIQDADHGLDIDNDLNRSLDEMKKIISRTLDFVTNG